MGKKKTTIKGQYALNLNPLSYVTITPAFAFTKQNLKLNSARIVRASIMQSNDGEVKPLLFTLDELSKITNIDKSNLSKAIEEYRDDIMAHPLYVEQTNEKGEVRWAAMPWVSACSWDPTVGFAIKLNQDLTPLLKGNDERQYQLCDYLVLKSVYAQRIYEMIAPASKNLVPKEGIDVAIKINALREYCNCEDKFMRISQFREKVLDIAVINISNNTDFKVDYKLDKEGTRAFKTVIFHLELNKGSSYRHMVKEEV